MAAQTCKTELATEGRRIRASARELLQCCSCVFCFVCVRPRSCIVTLTRAPRVLPRARSNNQFAKCATTEIRRTSTINRRLGCGTRPRQGRGGALATRTISCPSMQLKFGHIVQTECTRVHARHCLDRKVCVPVARLMVAVV